MLVMASATAWSDEADVDGLARVREKGSIEVAMYADYPPYSYGSAADAQGIDADLARAIAQRLGLKLKVRLIAAGESASDDLRNHVWQGHYLGGGVADLMLHVGYDRTFAEREKNVLFFEPYFHESVALGYKPARIAHLESPIELTEHKIAVEGDTISDHIMSSAYGGALRGSAVREQSLEAAVAAFKEGEVDAVMGPRGELEGLMQAQRVDGVVFRTQEPIGQMRTAWDVGMAVKDGSPNLRAAVTQAVQSMKADGSLDKIFKNHGVTYLDASIKGDLS